MDLHLKPTLGVVAHSIGVTFSTSCAGQGTAAHPSKSLRHVRPATSTSQWEETKFTEGTGCCTTPAAEPPSVT